MSSYKIRYSDELYHHGILGQKWGVRRFQNPDGSLTSEGRKRYSKNLVEIAKSSSRYSDDNSSEARKLVTQLISSDEANELRDLRLNYVKVIKSGNSEDFLNQIDDEIYKETDALYKQRGGASDWSECFSEAEDIVWKRYPKEKALEDKAYKAVDAYMDKSRELANKIIDFSSPIPDISNADVQTAKIYIANAIEFADQNDLFRRL